jgi:UDP-N-acetylglucosamine--N-acetylmuramyl-(pentapeptide) pyrophosphoryl-undecaprenol N-acetylglucosamine transferase
MKKIKLLITGGHLAPALSIIDELQTNHAYNDVFIIFVGRKYPLEGDKTLSLEYEEIRKRNIRFVNLLTGRFTRAVSFRTIIGIVKIPLGFFNALKILIHEKPDIVLSFGGYLALPIALWSFIFRIPIFTHEQTIHPGLANKIIGSVSKKVFVSFEQAALYFDIRKTMAIGNPIRKSIFTTIKIPFEIHKDSPVIYITGGSLGSHSINTHIFEILKDLLKQYIVIHQTGDTVEYKDYEKSIAIQKKLPEELRKRYFPAKFIHDDEIGFVYSVADVVVGRSGANTLFELITLKKPAVLIPLPWSGKGEQEAHAKLYKKIGGGEIFHQNEQSKKLLELINAVVINKFVYAENLKQLQSVHHEKAASEIITTIFQSS